MKILHNNSTAGHNVVFVGEGLYRISDFAEMVSMEQLKEFSVVSEFFIKTTHTPQYVQKIRDACNSRCCVAEVSLSSASYIAMVASATLSIMVAKEGSFAVVRPPGHHASREKAGGFCFLNNVAIATSYLLAGGKRVAIIDIDDHHGNGTQSIFRDDGGVMFSSIHQMGIYPHSGQATDIGKGPSFKKVVNILWMSGSGDDVFLKSLIFIINKVELFDPDCIAVSAGFDGYFKDSILGLRYSKEGYYEAGKLIGLLSRPTFAVLENGYHGEVKSCTDVFIAGISGDLYCEDEFLSVSSNDCIAYIQKTLNDISVMYS
jgi:acetoin utilization deacetylase AcuC-like enzyme